MAAAPHDVTVFHEARQGYSDSRLHCTVPTHDSITYSGPHAPPSDPREEHLSLPKGVNHHILNNTRKQKVIVSAKQRQVSK